jgi:hypothetical protein
MWVARPEQVVRADSLSSLTSSPCHRMWSQTLISRSAQANAARAVMRSALTSSQRGNCSGLLRKPRRVVSEVKGSLKFEVWKFETFAEGRWEY